MNSGPTSPRRDSVNADASDTIGDGWTRTALRLGLRANGYWPVPVAGPELPCSSAGKRPLLADWRNVCANADESEIRRWEATLPSSTNTGLLCGEMVGVDQDITIHELAEAVDAIAEEILGPTPLHRIGRSPKRLRCYRAEAPLAKMETPELILDDGAVAQIEIMGVGQQVIAYGIHPDTRQPYAWPDGTPLEVSLPALPVVSEAKLRAFLVAVEGALRAAGGRTRKERETVAAPPDPIETAIPKASKQNSEEKSGFFLEVNRRALANIPAWFRALFPKAWHEKSTGAWRVSSKDLGRSLEEDISVHPEKGGQDFGMRESCSAIDLVMKHGRATSVEDAAFWICERLGVTTADCGWKEPRTKLRPELKGVHLDEDGVATAFTNAHRDELRYCHHAQHWFVWTGSLWKREETELAFLWARQKCREAAKDLPPNDKVRRIIARASTAAAVERFAQADRAFAVTADRWDRDPWLLGTPNGTVDLRTGELRAAEPGDYITKSVAIAPAPSGTPHPIWSEFLAQATGRDAEFEAFLHRQGGYCLTGEVTEEILWFLYGEGGTGKGTLLGTFVAIMADYAVSVPIEVFTAGTRLNLEYDRAQMAGARLVTASETEAGATWAESQLKELTGNETPLSGRHPYGKVFTFRPRFKIALVGNHAPRLRGRTRAMERRLRIAPFKHVPKTPDQELKEKLRAEYPAILRWMIDGCLVWQASRLGTCRAVAAETGKYFEQQDAFARWQAERCVVANAVSERPSKLLADFLVWAKESGEAPVSSSEFRETIERTPGLRYAKNGGVQWVRGLELKTTGATPRSVWAA